MQAIKFKEKNLFYLDQRKLPGKEIWRECLDLESGWQAIRELRVRGAPLIGIFAAYCICVHLKRLPEKGGAFFRKLQDAFDYLKSSRPTAVNLFWALDRLAGVALSSKQSCPKEVKKLIIREAELIHREDQFSCQKISEYGEKLLKNNDNILTHCNTGFLAASDPGTALGAIYRAKKRGKALTVYVDETRPLLQGSRLTAWELNKKKIKHFLISDNTAAFLMQKKKIDKILVGADRITASGDTANKVGTYSLAVLARYHRIPFYVAAPQSTFDLSLSKGEDIIIERRDESEIKKVLGSLLICPDRTKAINFAFDITPAKLITAIITDKGVVYPPYRKNIRRLIA